MTDSLTPETLRAALAEFIVTALFVFLAAGTVIISGTLDDGGGNTIIGILIYAFSSGFAIAVLAGATFHISGGHINPAVTIALMVSGQIGPIRGTAYIIAQILGAIFGTLLLKVFVASGIESNLGAHTLAQGVTVGTGLVVEIVLTFILVFVIFAVAIDNRSSKTIAPILIGLTVTVALLMGGGITGSSLNPARSFGPALISGTWDEHWIYWVGPIIGAAAAAIIYKTLFLLGDEKTSEKNHQSSPDFR